MHETLVNLMKLRVYEMDDNNAEAAHLIMSHIVDLVGLDAVLAAIPDNWEFSENMGGDNPTKEDFAKQWLWEQINPSPNEYDNLNKYANLR